METEFAPVYFNSITKTLISSDKSIQEILYKIDNWINEGFGWVIESIEDEYYFWWWIILLSLVHYQEAETLNYLIS